MKREDLPRAFVELHADRRLVTRFIAGDWASRLEILAWRTVEWTHQVDDVRVVAVDDAVGRPLAYAPFATGDVYQLVLSSAFHVASSWRRSSSLTCRTSTILSAGAAPSATRST